MLGRGCIPLRLLDVRLYLHRQVDVDRSGRFVARWKGRVLQLPLVVVDVVLRLLRKERV